MRTLFAIFIALICLLVFLLMIQFGVFAPRIALHIAASPQHRAVEPLITHWAERNKAEIQYTWLSAPDMARTLSEGADPGFDAVWPDSALWIEMGDTDNRLRHQTAVYRAPVILGLRTSTVIGLGWIGRSDITMQEITQAAQEGKFRLVIPSPGQSGPGAAAYVSLLKAQSTDPKTLTEDDLANAALRDSMDALLSRMDRAPVSALELADAFVENYAAYDGMITTESLIARTSQRLAAEGEEPLYAIYPTDSVEVIESPLAFVSGEDEAKEAKFLDLADFLASDEAQDVLVGLGHRAGPDGPVGRDAPKAEGTLWNPDWGIDPTARFAATPPPSAQIMRDALQLYRTAMDKPELTVWVLDVSNAMQGIPLQALKSAVDAFFETDGADLPDSKDVTILLPFSHNILDPITVEGHDTAAIDRAKDVLTTLEADGGTDLYYAIYEAYEAVRPYVEDGRFADFKPAIIVVTAGPSETENRIPLLAHISETPYTKDIPIHTVALGAADTDQLTELSKLSSGQAFLAGSDLGRTLRLAEGVH